MKALITALFAVILLSGCATQKTVDMADSYNAAYEAYAESEADKVDQKATAIKEVMDIDCEDNSQACGAVKAMSGMIAAERIAGIKADPFTLDRHATDIDAQIAGIKAIGKGLPVLTMGVVATKAIEDDKGTVNNNATEGSTVNNSYDEDHATNLGDDASSNNYPDHDNSSESIEVTE